MECRNAHSFCLFSKENKKQTQSNAFLFSFSEESVKGIQNDGLIFPFSEESIKRIANHAILIPFSLSRRKDKKEFGMMNSFFLFSHKNKTGNLIRLYPPCSLVPMLSLHANGPGNEATLQEYGIALD